MKDRTKQLKNNLGRMAPKEVVTEIQNIPEEDGVNVCGFVTYSLEDELRLLSMLNVLKTEKQFYRSEDEQIVELRDLIEKLAIADPYFVAQCIVYSRCKGEGMRSINHLAAALLAPFISGQEYAKRFYGAWDKKNQKGGCIFRPDDMSNIKDVYVALNKSSLSNAMKKGFASYIENMDAYLLTKYKKTVIDIANLVHPKSNVTIKDENGKEVNVLNALMNGVNIVADTWETAQTKAGQEVAQAVREGKIKEEEAEKILKEAKERNWKSLIEDNKLGILAALRNIRSILNVTEDDDLVNKLCNIISDSKKIREGLIMPYQIDMAREMVLLSHNNMNSRKVLEALNRGYEKSVPNLREALPGKTLVIVDCSGSMSWINCINPKNKNYYRSSCKDKAGLIAATIAKSTYADVIRFGNYAEYVNYDPTENVFELGKKLVDKNMGGTNFSIALKKAAESGKVYDRIIILSDNESNCGIQVSKAYKNYVRATGKEPYCYIVDFAGLGHSLLKPGNKVSFYAGYGFAMFDDIASKEFDPMKHINKVREIII
ncbi:MAG: hypothetical protein J1F35_08250 [Erysipelotrichales bacterium]|nr:hypothetical protein [Erysipelotrichales bacterium]